jgi:hypothetical protein
MPTYDPKAPRFRGWYCLNSALEVYKSWPSQHSEIEPVDSIVVYLASQTHPQSIQQMIVSLPVSFYRPDDSSSSSI